MRAAVWGALAVVALAAALALIVASFTWFDDGPVPQDPAGQREYEQEQYADARVASAMGIAGAFTLLGSAACAQKAWRTRTSS